RRPCGGGAMRSIHWLLLPALAGALAVAGIRPPTADSACCYFSAKDKDILQPAQKVFITWDPKEQVESFTVQPKFKGNALDFGMVIPTPSKPKLDEMPRDFFKELAVYTILKKREQPQSKLLLDRRVFEQLMYSRMSVTRDEAGAAERGPRPK